MNFTSTLLNLPWTIIGLIGTLFSLPVGVKFSSQPFAVIFKVRSFWWYAWLPGQKGVRAMTNGNTVQIGPDSDANDLAHELIHVEQFTREPFIHPLLYVIQSLRFGYRNNKYEREAYSKSRSRYAGD